MVFDPLIVARCLFTIPLAGEPKCREPGLRGKIMRMDVDASTEAWLRVAIPGGTWGSSKTCTNYWNR